MGAVDLKKSKQHPQFLTKKLFALTDKKCGIEVSLETEVQVWLCTCCSLCFQKEMAFTFKD